MVAQRKADRKFPYIAIRTEINAKVLSDIRATIDELEADGLVSHSENINGIELYRNLKEIEETHLKTCE